MSSQAPTTRTGLTDLFNSIYVIYPDQENQNREQDDAHINAIAGSLSTAIQDLVEECTCRSSVIGKDFERFPVFDGCWRGYQVSRFSRRFALPGRDDARLNTVRIVLASFFYSLCLPAPL
jgi:hypothetical protein